MQYLKSRESNPQYLKNVIQQKMIIVQEQQRKYKQLQKQNQILLSKINSLKIQIQTQQNASKNQILNLNHAIKQQQIQIQSLNHDKSEYDFQINMLKIQIRQRQKQNQRQVDKIKMQHDSQKQNLNIKILKLQKNISSLKQHYHIDSQIYNDKMKIIQDSNRNLRGFSNEKQQRMIILQNQQYANQIQFQAKQIQSLLKKNQKLQQQINNLKINLDLHKQIQNDLVKRSSLAQTLIKQLNKRLKQQQQKQSTFTNSVSNSQIRSVIPSQQSSRVSMSKVTSSNNLKDKQTEQELKKIKFEYASLKNHCNYLESMQKIYNQKYQTLGAIMAEYLQNLLYFKQKDKRQSSAGDDTLKTLKQINLDITSLKNKDIKQWKTQQIQTIIFLLINQVKPFLSKNSLIKFPEMKNVSISFVESDSKDPVSLPKITQNYQKTYQKQANKINNRFKDIPLDISTKILRSNLREWGTKINYGIPNISNLRKLKSKSIANDVDRSSYI